MAGACEKGFTRVVHANALAACALRMHLLVKAAAHRVTTCCCHAVNTTGGWTWDQGAQPAGRQVRNRGIWGVEKQMCT